MIKRSLKTGPFLLLALAACDKDPSGPPVPKNLASILVSPPVPVVAPGATLQLSVTTVDTDDNLDYDVAAEWRSLDTDVAQVSNRGLLTGRVNGKARVVATLGTEADTATVFVSDTPLMGLNAQTADGCETVLPVGARIAATSQRVNILHDIDNPAGGFTNAEYQVFADAFDQIIWPSNLENFGEPTDVDRSGKVNVLFTRRVNELTPVAANYVVGGFYYVRDLFPRRENSAFQGCPTSNEGEILYMLAPDPGGAVNGHVRSKDYIRESALATLAHEFQHLINAGRRLYVVKITSIDEFETVWLDEGLSHIAEELAFYRATGLGPRQDLNRAQVASPSARLDAFYEYGDQNFGRLGEYYRAPSSNSPIANDDALATRGATWQFLRYAADRRGGTERDLWQALVNTKEQGVVNLNAQMGGNALNWMRDWSISVYADNRVPGIAGVYNQPSWNYHDMLSSPRYSSGGQSPLDVRQLANGAQLPLSLRAGSGAYVRFGVAPGTRAELRTTSGGGTVEGSCTVNGSTPSLPVGGVFTGDPTTASVLCLDGGATGAEFVYIPFFSATAGTLAVEVSGTGIVPVLAVNPAWLPGAPAATPLAELRNARVLSDGGYELALRRRERAELARLLPGGRTAPSMNVAAAQAPATLRISILRTR